MRRVRAFLIVSVLAVVSDVWAGLSQMQDSTGVTGPLTTISTSL